MEEGYEDGRGRNSGDGCANDPLLLITKRRNDQDGCLSSEGITSSTYRASSQPSLAADSPRTRPRLLAYPSRPSQRPLLRSAARNSQLSFLNYWSHTRPAGGPVPEPRVGWRMRRVRMGSCRSGKRLLREGRSRRYSEASLRRGLQSLLKELVLRKRENWEGRPSRPGSRTFRAKGGKERKDVERQSWSELWSCRSGFEEGLGVRTESAMTTGREAEVRETGGEVRPREVVRHVPASQVSQGKHTYSVESSLSATSAWTGGLNAKERSGA